LGGGENNKGSVMGHTGKFLWGVRPNHKRKKKNFLKPRIGTWGSSGVPQKPPKKNKLVGGKKGVSEDSRYKTPDWVNEVIMCWGGRDNLNLKTNLEKKGVWG